MFLFFRSNYIWYIFKIKYNIVEKILCYKAKSIAKSTKPHYALDQRLLEKRPRKNIILTGANTWRV